MDKATMLEIIAPTADEAVEKGLNQLGLKRDSVEIEVLDNGNRGLFGLGSRQARVRLTIKTQIVFEEIKEPEPVVEAPAPIVIENHIEKSTPAVQQTEDGSAVLQAAREVVRDLLEKMKVPASVDAVFVTHKEADDEETVLVNIEGDDLSILIGRRSETLNALQYIAGLIINKQLGRMVPLLIDVQGFRARRENRLRQMARKMAEQAIHTGRKQSLEPMPANERRLIHLELRNHPQVLTESIGEEPNRKVTIRLKK